MATIFVIRKHALGNITYCMYGVDLLCCGITHSLYWYNEPEEYLRKILERVDHDLIFEQTQYDLVHNIIYAAIEFADKYGFKPVSEFTSVTQYLLEEDNENIPMIDIHCGDDNGKPVYINSGEDSPAKEQQILAQLDKTAGQGNYEYILHDEFDDDDEDDDFYDDDDDDFDDDDFYDDDDDDFDDDDFYDDDDDDDDFDDDDFYDDDFDDDDYDFDDDDYDFDDDDEDFDDDNNAFYTYDALDDETLKTQFLKQAFDVDKGKNISENTYSNFMTMAGIILERDLDDDKCDKHIDFLKKVFKIEVVDLFDLPNSLFRGLKSIDINKLVKEYNAVFKLLLKGKEKKAIKKFRKEIGDIPYADYIELTILRTFNSDYDKKLDECYRKYPDYLLFQILEYSRSNRMNDLVTLISQRTEPVTDRELIEYLTHYIQYYLSSDLSPEKVVASETITKFIIKELDIRAYPALLYIAIVKINLVKKLCGYDEWVKNKENNE
ncbi:MAG: hypothetical protein LBE04_06925 [Prevotellaceae bacterium]|nr:hypothetical protein [Prevotellaceae bacterium]